MNPAQFGIAVLGVTAILLSQDKRLSRRRWSSIFGLAAQPLWFMETIQGEQWGMVFLCVVYTIAWGRGFATHWFAPAPKYTPESPGVGPMGPGQPADAGPVKRAA